MFIRRGAQPNFRTCEKLFVVLLDEELNQVQGGSRDFWTTGANQGSRLNDEVLRLLAASALQATEEFRFALRVPVGASVPVGHTTSQPIVV